MPDTIGESMASESKCPFTGGTRAHTNRDWWPNQLNLAVLHQHSALSNPMGGTFDYAKGCNSLDLRQRRAEADRPDAAIAPRVARRDVEVDEIESHVAVGELDRLVQGRLG